MASITQPQIGSDISTACKGSKLKLLAAKKQSYISSYLRSSTGTVTSQGLRSKEPHTPRAKSQPAPKRNHRTINLFGTRRSWIRTLTFNFLLRDLFLGYSVFCKYVPHRCTHTHRSFHQTEKMPWIKLP